MPTKIAITSGEQVRRMPGKFITSVNAGDVMCVEMPGAGGWGDPLERNPELVLQDVVEEKVSPQRARAKYGVVVDGANRQVDQAATAKLREAQRRKKG